MSPSAVIDTHAAIWYLNADTRLSNRAKTFLEDATQRSMPVFISSITLIEIIYLQEKGKIPAGTLIRLENALRVQDSVLQVADLTTAVAMAVSRVSRDDIPDMPDRIIAGAALHFGVPVISRDGKIKNSILTTIW
jgi:PIN domain nuclease of toxin-antitoxin system